MRPRTIYRSRKFYDHSEGLSCIFRQPLADSHCNLVHGYALAVGFTFATYELDARNWCFDFGAMKPVKAWLKDNFDHTMAAAADDPALAEFQRLHDLRLVSLRILPAVGCEAFARHIHGHVSKMLAPEMGRRVWLERVDVSEHGANSASYEETPEWAWNARLAA